MLLPVHILAGALAMLLGAVALLASKGATLHRRSGRFFVYAMLTMGLSGSILAMRQSWTNANALGGLMAAYFVITAFTTVKPASVWTRRLDRTALLLGTALAVVWFYLGIRGTLNPRPGLDPMMVYSTFVFGTILTLAAAGDLRLLRVGTLHGPSRIARHLWRMCFAFFIAVASFFAIPERVARILPDAFTTPAMRGLPVAMVFLAMFYWLWRVRRRGIAPSQPAGGVAPVASR